MDWQICLEEELKLHLKWFDIPWHVCRTNVLFINNYYFNNSISDYILGAIKLFKMTVRRAETNIILIVGHINQGWTSTPNVNRLHASHRSRRSCRIDTAIISVTCLHEYCNMYTWCRLLSFRPFKYLIFDTAEQNLIKIGWNTTGSIR